MLAFALFQKNSYLYYTISESGRWFFLLISMVLTIIAPLISVGYLVYSKQVTSIYLDQRKERIIPMTIALAYTMGLYYMLLKMSMPPIILAIVAIGVIQVAITLLITLFWKISAHMIGIAGFGGAILAMSQLLQPVPTWVIIALFVLAGVVGSARIKQDSHTLTQVIAGWVLGFGISYFTLMIMATGTAASI
tara:strand:+ start:28630 stop:29205 length:576 start_codon:yes stop_codon:yes gene_type:complete